MHSDAKCNRAAEKIRGVQATRGFRGAAGRCGTAGRLPDAREGSPWHSVRVRSLQSFAMMRRIALLSGFSCIASAPLTTRTWSPPTALRRDGARGLADDTAPRSARQICRIRGSTDAWTGTCDALVRAAPILNSCDHGKRVAFGCKLWSRDVLIGRPTRAAVAASVATPGGEP